MDNIINLTIFREIKIVLSFRLHMSVRLLPSRKSRLVAPSFGPFLNRVLENERASLPPSKRNLKKRIASAISRRHRRDRERRIQTDESADFTSGRARRKSEIPVSSFDRVEEYGSADWTHVESEYFHEENTPVLPRLIREKWREYSPRSTRYHLGRDPNISLSPSGSPKVAF